MKGMVFTEFVDMVEDRFGLGMVDKLIEAVQPASGGVYTSVGNYDAGELVALVVELGKQSDTPIPELLEAFGHKIFGLFTRSYGHFFAEATSATDFLQGIEGYIHVEVRKLYPDAELPRFDYPPAPDGMLIMEYHSERPLAHFALGLINATVEHYGDPIEVTFEDISNGRGTDARFTLITQRG